VSVVALLAPTGYIFTGLFTDKENKLVSGGFFLKLVQKQVFLPQEEDLKFKVFLPQEETGGLWEIFTRIRESESIISKANGRESEVTATNGSTN